MIKLSYFRALEHASYEFKCHVSYSFSKLHVILSLALLNAVCPWFVCVCALFFFLPLVVAPKGGKKFKTRANRNLGSSSSSSALGDRERFMSANMRRHMRS